MERLVGEVKLTKNDMKVIMTMKKRGGRATTKELFLETHMDEAYLWEKLKKLMDLGFVTRIGRGVYALTPLCYQTLFPDVPEEVSLLVIDYKQVIKAPSIDED